MALTMHPSLAVHPGDWLKTEIVQANGVSIGALADAFGVSRQAVSALLNGRAALSAEMAIRFEKLFGIKADTLCRMQTAYDLARARTRQDDIHVDRTKLAA
jgi:antitoxin HigA-1